MKQFTVFLLLMISVKLFASDKTSDSLQSQIHYGVYADLNYNLHSANFHRIPGYPNCCLSFESGTGVGYTVGALFEYLFDQNLQVSLRLNMSNLSAKLTRTEATTIIPNGISVPGEFEHSLDATISDIGIEPLFGWRVTDALTIHAGFRLGNITTSTFSQKETITKPANTGTFLDSLGNDSHSRTRNVFSGDIPNVNSLQIYGVWGVSYDLPLNKKRTWLICPEIFYNLDFSNVIQDSVWHLNSLKLGVSVKYVPSYEPEPIHEYKREENIDTIRIPEENITEVRFMSGVAHSNTKDMMSDGKLITLETYSRTDTLLIPKIPDMVLTGDVNAIGVDSAGNEIPNPRFRIEEFEYKRLFPLLNYVFFDENQSKLPTRYKTLEHKAVSSFVEDSLYEESTLGVYYNLLNIIGSRLREHPKAKVILTGCNSGLGSELNNLSLSNSRAENVRNYFVNTFGIDGSRITIKSQNLPDKPSTPTNEAEKIEENRRVEIVSDDPSITAPLDIERIERKSNPPVLRFLMSENSNQGISKWTLKATNGTGSEAREFETSGTGNVPSSTDWNLEDNQKIIPRYAVPVVYTLSLVDTKGNKFITQPKLLPLDVLTIKRKRQQKQADFEIEKFSLILFDFDKWDISSANKSIVNLIKSRISPESQIEIIGYTDKTGEADHNQQLSKQRSQTAKSALNRPDAIANGQGENQLIYDNDLPEGRFYCRTVDIIVKTPVK